MTADTKLLPCPFCGGAVDKHDGHADITYVGCNNGCGAVVSFRPHLKGGKTVAAWNTRQAAAALAETQAEVAALREDATFFRWLAVYPNLYTVADLLRADQYVTLRRACESLVPIDAAGEGA